MSEKKSRIKPGRAELTTTISKESIHNVKLRAIQIGTRYGRLVDLALILINEMDTDQIQSLANKYDIPLDKSRITTGNRGKLHTTVIENSKNKIDERADTLKVTPNKIIEIALRFVNEKEVDELTTLLEQYNIPK